MAEGHLDNRSFKQKYLSINRGAGCHRNTRITALGLVAGVIKPGPLLVNITGNHHLFYFLWVGVWWEGQAGSCWGVISYRASEGIIWCDWIPCLVCGLVFSVPVLGTSHLDGV